MRCEKREISQKRTEALISRPFTGNLAPNPSSNSPFTDNGFAVKKSARELNLCFTGSREGDIAITALSIDNGYSQLATRILVYRDPKPTPMAVVQHDYVRHLNASRIVLIDSSQV